MVRFSKNILASLSVLTQALVLLLLVIFHGTNTETDFLFLALSIVTISQLIILMPFDQFIVYFNRIKSRVGINSAIGFYYKTFVSSVSTSVVVAFSVFLGLQFFVNSGLADFISTGVMHGFLLALPAYAIIALNDRFFNAEGAILKSYLLVLIPNIALLVGVTAWTFGQDLSVYIVSIIYSCIMWLGAIVSTIYVWKSNGFYFKCESCEIKAFVINSCFMRLGHNFYTISFQLITNFVLLGFQEGALSLFNYAYRSIIALFTVAVGPSNRVYMYELAKKAANQKVSNYSEVANTYLKESVSIYILLLSFLMILVYLFDYFDLQSNFSNLNLDMINYLVLTGIIGAWQAIVIFESVFVGVLITSTKANVFIFVNIVFALTFFTLTFFTSRFEDVIVFSLSGLTAQVASFLMYKYYVKKKLFSEEAVCTNRK
ncbi:hypothetical protein QCB45_04700 [Thiomicrorhabdus sp. ZW0627]|uniref:hypothetical protein n=1 Tax=Thiomicrorhabdus sp. ZW0627 TaxID=3039774 RepID=UPI0024369A50|nr:hypothetical protein [Thiomicrorhabdus sp. ZW0627]MDG6773621.1 hypothetical protein [Thiomicrorhabdus sp. ZW0627]